MKTINHLPKIEWIDLKKFEDSRNAVLFTSPSAEKECGAYLRGINFTGKIYIQTADKASVERLTKEQISADVGYAIGGGRVIDVAKFLAKEWGLEIICVPTIISSDAFLVDCTGLRENGCVTYIPSKKADRVLLDWKLLKKTPLKYHLSGCGDVLSIYTGVHDWQYANKQGIVSPDESYSQSVAVMAKGILEGLFSEAEEIRRGTRKGLETIITCLGMEVELCNFYGNSRPEEGGEHFFAYCIENRTKHFLHGEIVSLGVLITAFLQNSDWRKVKEFLDGVNLDYKPNVINKQIVHDTLQQMKNYVKKHKLPYSIYNEFNYEARKDAIDNFLDILKIKD